MAASEDPLVLPAVIPRNIDLGIFPRLVEHIPDFRILYCNVCKQVCFPSALLRHLTEIHKVPAARRRPVVQFCLSLDVVDTKSDLRPLLDRSAILDFAPVFDGYACTCCRFLRVRSSIRIVTTPLSRFSATILKVAIGALRSSTALQIYNNKYASYPP